MAHSVALGLQTFYPEAFIAERKWGLDFPVPTASSPVAYRSAATVGCSHVSAASMKQAIATTETGEK